MSEMTAWQRWEMNPFQDAVRKPAHQRVASPAPKPAPEPSFEALVPTPLIDENELRRLREEARLAGEAEGREQGYIQGRAEGHAAGLEAARAEAAQLRALALALPSAMRGADQAIADDLVTLALEIASQVLRQAVAVDPQRILAVVRELLHAEPALAGTPRLMLHVDDVALVNKYLAEDLQAIGWTIRADPTITRGGCRVTAASGSRDATLEARIERVAAALGRNPLEFDTPPHD